MTAGPWPFPLGRHREHDPASRGFAASPTAPVVDKYWRRYGLVLDQGNLGSCTGNAGRGAQNHSPLHVAGTHTYKEPAAVNLYSAATKVDSIPGFYDPSDPASQDTGSSGLAIAKVLKTWGEISVYLHSFGFDHVLATAMLGAQIIGSDWTEDMFYPDSSGLVRPTGAVAGGHEYVLSGVSVTDQIVRFQNSWGSSWGVYGKFYMRFSDFAQLLAAGGDAILLQAA